MTPVLAYWREPQQLHPVDTAEVGAIIHHPIRHLMDPSNRFSVTHPSGWKGPGFDVGSEVPLWGFTGGIISRLFERLGWEQPWDDTVTRPLPEIM